MHTHTRQHPNTEGSRVSSSKSITLDSLSEKLKDSRWASVWEGWNEISSLCPEVTHTAAAGHGTNSSSVTWSTYTMSSLKVTGMPSTPGVLGLLSQRGMESCANARGYPSASRCCVAPGLTGDPGGELLTSHSCGVFSPNLSCPCLLSG